MEKTKNLQRLGSLESERKHSKVNKDKTLVLSSVLLMAVMVLGIFSQFGTLVSADSDEDEEDNKKKIEIDSKKGRTKVKVEIGESQWKFNLKTNDLDVIISEIASRTGLSVDEINNLINVNDFGLGSEEDNESNFGDDDSNIGEVSLVQRVQVTPKKQFTFDGNATFNVTVKDLHINCTNITDSNNSTNSTNQTNNTNSTNQTNNTTNSTNTTTCKTEYAYTLDFEAQSGVTGEFEDDEFVLKPGESKTVKLDVETNKTGVNNFTVISTSENTTAKSKGLLVYVTEAPKPIISDIAFFIGKGFILNDDETEGFLLDLKVLNKNGVLSGKATIGKNTYRLEGSISSNTNTSSNSTGTGFEVEFDLISPKSKEVVGSFLGKARTFNDFRLLEGTLKNFDNGIWDLTATSKRKIHLTREDLDSLKPFKVGIDNIITIGGNEDDEDISIRPIEVKKKKLFGLIETPWGKRIVKVEIVKDNKITEKFLEEKKKEKFEKYHISVGSLENEEEIEIEVEELEEED